MKKTAIVLSVLFGCLCALVLSALAGYLIVTKGVKLDRNKLTLDTACIRLFDGKGEEIERAEKRNVSVDELPDHVPNAFVSVEDKRFYSHRGFDFKRIAKAAMKNLSSFSFREGASTISQQVIKNTHLSGEKTLKRKLREFKLTRALEKNYSKSEILGLYLNSIYFGHDAFGIARASEFYFGKRAEELLPAESAMLAALVRSPNRYSPFRDADACLKRRNFVLSLMKEQGFLTQSEYADAANTPLPEEPAQTEGGKNYLSLVFEELFELFPEFKTDETGSLNVYTFLDADLQRDLESVEAESDISLLALDNETHGLLAYRSTCGGKRSPASALKPLLVYAPAIEENFISPATPLSDERTDFGGYSPDDAGGASGKYMSARYALAHSVNIPAVKLLNEMGCDRACRYLERLDMPVEEEDKTLALALGGMKEGFSLRSLADGYSALACGGAFSPSRTISRVETKEKKLLYSFSPKIRRVFSEETSFLVNDMLKTAAREGTAKRLSALPYPVCAKTGTAEADGKNTDAYTLAYTREHTVAAWLGNRDNSPVNATGGGLPANLALQIFHALYGERAPEPFPECGKIVRAEYDKEEYENRHRLVLADPLSPAAGRGSELFKKDFLPRETCSRYSSPSIEKPCISVKNGTVYIELCQTYYYEYTVKRENRGKITTIYSGNYKKYICDNSVRAGESYVYTVTPSYEGRAGTPVTLPSVRIEKSESVPDDWWIQSSIFSSVPSASSTNPPTSSFLSSSSMKESAGRMAGCSGRKTVQQSS